MIPYITPYLDHKLWPITDMGHKTFLTYCGNADLSKMCAYLNMRKDIQKQKHSQNRKRKKKRFDLNVFCGV